MSFSPELRLGDLTKFSSKYNGNLSVNDSCVGTYIEEEHIFITTPNNTFIPHPPTTYQVHLYEDRQFGHHDPTRVPQFFNERFCHFSVIPCRPAVYNVNHPYHQWIDTIWYNVTQNDIVFSHECVSHISLLHESVHGQFKHALTYITGRYSLVQKRQKFSEAFQEFLSIRYTCLETLVHRTKTVMTDVMSIHMQVAAMQRYWLELVAGLDYMEIHQLVMNGTTQCNNSLDFTCLMGTFTLNLDVAEQHLKAGIPVYLIRPTEEFTNQIILKAEKPIVISVNDTIPEPSFPIVFKGVPSQAKKFDAMHHFMKIFQTYRNPFLFPTTFSPTTSTPSSAIHPSGSGGPIHDMRGKAQASGPLSSKQPSQRKKIRKGHYPFKRSRGSPFLLESLQSARDKFADLSRTYAPLPMPAWVTANATIDQNSECSQQHEEQVYHLQSELHMKNNQDHNKGYAFPDPELLVFTSETHQSSYFFWRELLLMPFKKESITMTKDHNAMVEMMGTALQAAGDKTTFLARQMWGAENFQRCSFKDEVSLTVEKSLAAHYTQTFFNCFGWPPVLPHIQPSHQ
ncbi:hypothetical protein ARMGADRAFT_1033775 [Armillaria gallica]|uniref:Uncharacterized protein n=1 Tax=Armillaria gallica TaxID=47427 RepID=A0A2H3D4T3_ARMGA|nr:hypothetical protein ARMGADRAFT_1033775 [Armillaria gallica]